MIAKNAAFLPQMVGVTPPGGVYTHIVGIDIVRTGEDDFFVLEDKARTPRGVSYMLENRETMLQIFPELFSRKPRAAGIELSAAAAPQPGRLCPARWHWRVRWWRC